MLGVLIAEVTRARVHPQLEVGGCGFTMNGHIDGFDFRAKDPSTP